MPSSHPHLQHLSAILNEKADPTRRRPLTEKRLLPFFDSMALDRVRISRTDWQGHRVQAMLRRLTDLRPSVRAVLSGYVVDRWNAGTDSMADIPFSRDIAEPLPAEEPVMPAQQPQTAAPGNTAATVPHRPFHTTEPVSRRDWFDRFTDWVAAVVSLLQ